MAEFTKINFKYLIPTDEKKRELFLKLKPGELVSARVMDVSNGKALVSIKGTEVLTETNRDLKKGDLINLRIEGFDNNKVVVKVEEKPVNIPITENKVGEKEFTINKLKELKSDILTEAVKEKIYLKEEKIDNVVKKYIAVKSEELKNENKSSNDKSQIKENNTSKGNEIIAKEAGAEKKDNSSKILESGIQQERKKADMSTEKKIEVEKGKGEKKEESSEGIKKNTDNIPKRVDIGTNPVRQEKINSNIEKESKEDKASVKEEIKNNSTENRVEYRSKVFENKINTINSEKKNNNIPLENRKIEEHNVLKSDQNVLNKPSVGNMINQDAINRAVIEKSRINQTNKDITAKEEIPVKGSKEDSVQKNNIMTKETTTNNRQQINPTLNNRSADNRIVDKNQMKNIFISENNDYKNIENKNEPQKIDKFKDNDTNNRSGFIDENRKEWVQDNIEKEDKTKKNDLFTTKNESIRNLDESSLKERKVEENAENIKKIPENIAENSKIAIKDSKNTEKTEQNNTITRKGTENIELKNNRNLDTTIKIQNSMEQNTKIAEDRKIEIAQPEIDKKPEVQKNENSRIDPNSNPNEKETDKKNLKDSIFKSIMSTIRGTLSDENKGAESQKKINDKSERAESQVVSNANNNTKTIASDKTININTNNINQTKENAAVNKEEAPLLTVLKKETDTGTVKSLLIMEKHDIPFSDEAFRNIKAYVDKHVEKTVEADEKFDENIKKMVSEFKDGENEFDKGVNIINSINKLEEKNQIDFMLMINGENKPAEITINYDKSKGNFEMNKENFYLGIKLDLKNLGEIEIKVAVWEKHMELLFNMANKDGAAVIKENIEEIKSKLTAMGYIPDEVRVKTEEKKEDIKIRGVNVKI